MDGPSGGRCDLAAQGTHHTRGQCLIQTKGIAYGEHLLPHLQIVRLADGNGIQLGRRCGYLQDRKVTIRCSPYQDCLPGRMISKRDFEPIGVGDHMIVSDDSSLFVPDKA